MQDELHPGELLPPKEENKGCVVCRFLPVKEHNMEYCPQCGHKNEDFFEEWPVDNPDETLDAAESCEVEIPTNVRPNDHIWELRNSIAMEIEPQITKNQNKWDEESVLV